MDYARHGKKVELLLEVRLLELGYRSICKAGLDCGVDLVVECGWLGGVERSGLLGEKAEVPHKSGKGRLGRASGVQTS